ncbi:transcriptional regulator, SarA/Rot family [Staphylococcus argensis]|nr:MarR family transcriptional regulator [Staphylococcus argensis]MCY6990892.1 MarR family transcriptional regulator [Staphylococcus argensis]
MDMIVYEEKRNTIKKEIKNTLKLSLTEVILLQKIHELNSEKLDVIELKKHLHNGNAPISAQLNDLIKKGYFKKQRDTKDERRIFLYDINLAKVSEALAEYHNIVSLIVDTEL